jgi:hypothetical protein
MSEYLSHFCRVPIQNFISIKQLAELRPPPPLSSKREVEQPGSSSGS